MLKRFVATILLLALLCGLCLSGLLGASILLGADILARSVAATELPVSIFTSLIGAPFLIGLIVRGRRQV